jgi:hypothetical protein
MLEGIFTPAIEVECDQRGYGTPHEKPERTEAEKWRGYVWEIFREATFPHRIVETAAMI